MKTQTLVVDLVRNWLPTDDTEDYMHLKLDDSDLVVVNTDAEFPGLEKIQGKLVWDTTYELDDPRFKERDLMIHRLFQAFGVATGSWVSGVRHVGNMTYIDYKTTDLKNVNDLEWVSLAFPKEVEGDASISSAKAPDGVEHD